MLAVSRYITGYHLFFLNKRQWTDSLLAKVFINLEDILSSRWWWLIMSLSAKDILEMGDPFRYRYRSFIWVSKSTTKLVIKYSCHIIIFINKLSIVLKWANGGPGIGFWFQIWIWRSFIMFWGELLLNFF